MKLNLPKITQPIPLADYAPELVHDDGSPAVVHAWVNPPTALLTRHAELRRQATEATRRIQATTAPSELAAAAQAAVGVGAELAEIYAELWSQAKDPATHWTAEDVKTVAASEANPALFRWLTGRTFAAINAYRNGLRKN